MKDFRETGGRGVAVLVDGENLAPALAAAILEAARAYGVPRVRRVYGKAGHVERWADAGFRPVFAGRGKNAADLLLSIEAMSLALRDGFECVIIASADQDFTHVAEHLREIGHSVIGMGDHRAPLRFRNVFSEFVEVSSRDAASDKADTLGEVCEIIRQAGPMGAALSGINGPLSRQGFRIGETPEKSWRKWFENRDGQFELDPIGPEARVRLRRDSCRSAP
ncbi:NYN domain-containing protein [Pseudogemmobacter sonorensis]|uniref:NYN domain-containing protein n=1 Tax=Pseudogemmobacter sonorensis TaxID=2989681 RepID=UPI0036A50182